jgi:hypothetical protein
MRQPPVLQVLQGICARYNSIAGLKLQGSTHAGNQASKPPHRHAQCAIEHCSCHRSVDTEPTPCSCRTSYAAPVVSVSKYSSRFD